MKAKDILKTKGVITLSPDAKLSEALSKFQSSHDAVFVVQHNLYLGLVNPYHHLIKRNYPPATKLKNCLFSAPKISFETDIQEVARLMLESKVHFLPVIDSNNRFLGIVTARRVLKAGLKSRRATDTIQNIIFKKPYLQTININSSFAEVLRFFEWSRLSKVVIVNDQNNLKGIVSLFDLLPLFKEPRQRKQFFDRGVTVSYLEKYSIKHFLKTATIKALPQQKISEAISLILDKKIGSVIIMKNNFEPENILTTSNLLVYLYLNERNFRAKQ